jgi:drug/metabolite transporter (DMT)-like permease
VIPEPLTPTKIIGAALVLAGVVLTRFARTSPAAPIEE